MYLNYMGFKHTLNNRITHTQLPMRPARIVFI